MKNPYQPQTREPRRSRINAWAVVVVLALATALVAACNGGGGDDGTATVQPTTEGSPIASPIGSPIGSPGPQPTAQAATSPACEALASLKSYRYTSNLDLESPEAIATPGGGQPTPVSTLTREFTGPVVFNYDIDASFVAPDRLDALITTQGGEPFNIIMIGGTSWMLSPTGAWQESPETTTIPYRPFEICNAIFPQLNLEQADGEKETVNEISAQHYVLPDTPSGQTFATIFGATSDMTLLFETMDIEVWVAEDDGWPVRMDIVGSGLYATGRELRVHIRVELRDINDEDIKVEAPA